MLSINYAKVPPLLSFLCPPLFTRENFPTPPRLPLEFHAHLVHEGSDPAELPSKGVESSTPRPIAARARPVTSRAPLRTVISQSHRRLPTNQPLPRLYLRANDFLSLSRTCSLFLFYFFNRASCKKEKTGTFLLLFLLILFARFSFQNRMGPNPSSDFKISNC